MAANTYNINRRMTVITTDTVASLGGKSLAKLVAALFGSRRLVLKNQVDLYDFSKPEVQRTYLSVPRGQFL